MSVLAVGAFVCTFCDKLFRTNRHRCKYDPELKNCFSCKHYAGFNEPEYVDEYHKDVLVNCKVDGDALFLNDLKSIGYELNCDKYEQDEIPLKERKKGWNP